MNTKKTILIVEDHNFSRDLLSRRLKRLGYDIVTASDGEQGLEVASSSRPDLILLDMNLPSMDGWTAAQKLKSSRDTRDIPIIAVTAHALEGDRDKALEAGCDDYDTKPIMLARLNQKMERLLSD